MKNKLTEMNYKKTLIVLLFISFISCKWIERKVNCDDFVPYNFSDTCVLWKINPTSNYVFGAGDAYYIWKKHGVILGGKFSITRSTLEDSCFFVKSKQYYSLKHGTKSLEAIVNKIDSLISIEDRSRIFYFDSVLRRIPSFEDTINKNAEVIDEDKYYKLKDSLSNTFTSKQDIFLHYWYLIDTAGNLENVELINCNCSEENQKKIFETLKVLKWKPAVYQNKKVKWRTEDFLYIKANSDKNTPLSGI